MWIGSERKRELEGMALAEHNATRVVPHYEPSYPPSIAKVTLFMSLANSGKKWTLEKRGDFVHLERIDG